ncbi:MAG: hypothetical protein WCC14_15960 [Acidobacteriaceae bacterium]
MQTPVSNSQTPQVYERWCDSTSGILFAAGVVLLICGGAITGNHHWNMIGLALIVFSSLVHLD